MLLTFSYIGIIAILALFALPGIVVRMFLTGPIYVYSLICIAGCLSVRRVLRASIIARRRLIQRGNGESIQDIGNCECSSARANHARRENAGGKGYQEKCLHRAMIAMGKESNQPMQSNDSIIESIQSNDSIDRFHLGRATKILFHVTGF